VSLITSFGIPVPREMAFLFPGGKSKSIESPQRHRFKFSLYPTVAIPMNFPINVFGCSGEIHSFEIFVRFHFACLFFNCLLKR
jgi:hypothetical protein